MLRKKVVRPEITNERLLVECINIQLDSRRSFASLEQLFIDNFRQSQQTTTPPHPLRVKRNRVRKKKIEEKSF